MFYLTAAIYVVGWVVYVLLAEGEVQSWADTSPVGAPVDTKVDAEDVADNEASKAMLTTSKI